MTQSEKIAKAVGLLSRDGKTTKVILFGSRARADSDEESDFDFLVLEDPLEDRIGEMVRLRRLLSSLRMPVDVVVASEKTFREWSTVPGNLFYEAATEGKILYEAA